MKVGMEGKQEEKREGEWQLNLARFVLLLTDMFYIWVSSKQWSCQSPHMGVALL